MKLLARLLLVLASLLVGPRVVVADDLPEDTNKIESLTVEQATQLVKEFPGVQAQVELKGATLPVGGCLPLNGVKSLDADTATMLADFDGLVFLNGLATLDADTATALAKFKGQLLHINGLTTLDADTARALAAYQGHYLLLDGLTTLDADTAELLAGFKGHNLSLTGLTTLAADAATALVAMEKWNGHLPAFSAFESPDSVAVAEALGTRKGPLALPNLTKISPKTLAALIEKEDIEIPRIKTLQLIPEPDGSLTEDFVIPERFRNR
jgi:hypothetical protein